jgi:hypothetical protein
MPMEELMRLDSRLNGFNDLHVFVHLRTALWRPRGGAVVMVGSGFSRNADPSPGAPPMPLWYDAVAHFAAQLYPANAPSRMRAVQRASGTSGLLRLAAEFEVAFGRASLDDFLREFVPDQQHNPGTLHRLLLELPWVDVLTTNYDTLLERTSLTGIGPSYSPVLVEPDISVAPRPRIVKLHGTFPSTRPFIFTDEDFRKYPQTHPSFMNLVQQCLLENVLCLIGFSGDDPNFLAWSGWVRDRLGSSTPNMYLIGLLDLSITERDWLRTRHTVPIDLSFLPLEGPNRHRKALEWLLRSLEQGKPPDNLGWPEDPEDVGPSQVDGIPTIPFSALSS